MSYFVFLIRFPLYIPLFYYVCRYILFFFLFFKSSSQDIIDTYKLVEYDFKKWSFKTNLSKPQQLTHAQKNTDFLVNISINQFNMIIQRILFLILWYFSLGVQTSSLVKHHCPGLLLMSFAKKFLIASCTLFNDRILVLMSFWSCIIVLYFVSSGNVKQNFIVRLMYLAVNRNFFTFSKLNLLIRCHGDL